MRETSEYFSEMNEKNREKTKKQKLYPVNKISVTGNIDFFV